MAMQAPEHPTTAELHQLYPTNEVTELRIDLGRQRFGNILSGEEPGTAAALGGCAMNGQTGIIRREGQAQYELTQNEAGLYVVHRRPPWKPRTDPNQWHGEETTNPEGAYRTLVEEAMWGAGVASEIGYGYHAERYGHLLTYGWFGGRQKDRAMMRQVVAGHRMLPIGVKNGLDGEVGPTLDLIEELRDVRGEGGAPIVLVYRGGENAKNPQAWEKQYRGVLEVTEGKMMVDTAHGTEMAHDPEGNFKKSVAGQRAASKRILSIARQGESPTAITSEVSDADSAVDPHMPHREGLDTVVELHQIRSGLVRNAA